MDSGRRSMNSPANQNQGIQQFSGSGSPPPGMAGQSGGYSSSRCILPPGAILGIVGGGNMGQSIAFPLFDNGLLNPASVLVSATSEGTLENWRGYGCKVTVRNEVLLREANIVLWAVKPQIFPGVVDSVSRQLEGKPLKDGTLHISIMAGIPLDRFVDKLKRGFTLGGITNHLYNFRSVRVMPNVALRVGTGVTVFASSSTANDGDKNLMFNMFQPNGLCYEVREDQINAYCALFGSGIGFMFPIIEAMSDGAVKMGIPRAISLEMAAQVMKGAGELILKEKSHPGVLKDTVCSPGGTTIAGISELEKGGIRAIVIGAIEAATARGEEIGNLSKRSN